MKTKKEVHRKLHKHFPNEVHRAKKLFGFRYPKLMLLVISIILAYVIFSTTGIEKFIFHLDKLSYLGIFIAGILLSFGFTTAFSIGFLMYLNPQNIVLATLIGGLGAVIGDLVIFKTIKFSFMDEFKRIEKIKTVQEIESWVKSKKHILLKHYLLYVFAGLIIATPLPDEIGVSILAGLTTIKQSSLTILSFILHSFSIYLILIIL